MVSACGLLSHALDDLACDWWEAEWKESLESLAAAPGASAGQAALYEECEHASMNQAAGVQGAASHTTLGASDRAVDDEPNPKRLHRSDSQVGLAPTCLINSLRRPNLALICF